MDEYQSRLRTEYSKPECGEVCLVKKLETVNKQVENKPASNQEKRKTNNKSPCTGMCAVMRGRTG